MKILLSSICSTECLSKKQRDRFQWITIKQSLVSLNFAEIIPEDTAPLDITLHDLNPPIVKLIAIAYSDGPIQ